MPHRLYTPAEVEARKATFKEARSNWKREMVKRQNIQADKAGKLAWKKEVKWRVCVDRG